MLILSLFFLEVLGEGPLKTPGFSDSPPSLFTGTPAPQAAAVSVVRGSAGQQE